MVFSTLGAKAWLIVREEEKRKLTEKKLHESEERFRQVAENSGDFIWEVDVRGLYTYASPSVEKILGYTPEELVGKKRFYDLFVPSVREEQKAAAFQVFADRQTFRDFPNSNVSRSGKIVHLKTSGAPVLDPAGNLIGDRVQIQQVLLNLVMNARDAMADVAPHDRQLTIRTNLAGNGSVHLSVADCGTGMAPDKLEHVFEPFYTTKSHGMGLGRTVCRTIIMAHGGSLWATNNPERGASFHFMLPARGDQ
jgi:PAS domain S-box-containing protein